MTTEALDTPDTLLLTPIGSRLYGSDHANSDYDYYRVVKDKSRTPGKFGHAHQTIVGDHDEVVIPLSAFVRYANAAAPQALEAMFSAEPLVDRIEAYRNGFHADMPNMRDVYSRTVYNFSHKDETKRRFHALRLVVNLNEAHETNGRFHPRLHPDLVKSFMHFATEGGPLYFALLHDLSYIDLGK